MPNHKLTALVHLRRKDIQWYLENHPRYHREDDERRFACTESVISVSGADRSEDKDSGWLYVARTLYKVNLVAGGYIEQFKAMIQKYGVTNEYKRDIDVCAEAHLWMTLAALHEQGGPARHRYPHPRNAHIGVFEIDSHNRPKEDSPCKNCRQWVRKEFLTVNGT